MRAFRVNKASESVTGYAPFAPLATGRQLLSYTLPYPYLVLTSELALAVIANMKKIRTRYINRPNLTPIPSTAGQTMEAHPSRQLSSKEAAPK